MKKNMKLLLFLLFFGFFFSNCTVKKRDAKTPVPSVMKVKTDFFFEFSDDRKTYKPRRFLYGKSIEDKTGSFSSIFLDHYNTAGSANIEFEFSEKGDQLVGRMYNPSFPNNKSKWKVIVTFNVSKSYYEEKRVDSSGRTSTDIIQRSDRSDPRARPYIEINLTSYRDKNRVATYLNKETQSVFDIEWDHDNYFLGFTTTSISQMLGPDAQVKQRVNFMAFTPNEKDFQKTAYHKDNGQYIQILHLISKKPNGIGEKLNAVHWDINSKTKKNYQISIHNFPEEYKEVAVNSIEAWNDVFEKDLKLGYRPLTYEFSNRKYAFDLRYHTLHWVDDIRLSLTGPLGIGNVAADLSNGKVLWTGAIIWGGALDHYVGREIPSLNAGSDHFHHHTHDISNIIPKGGVLERYKTGSLVKKGLDEFGGQHVTDILNSETISKELGLFEDPHENSLSKKLKNLNVLSKDSEAFKYVPKEYRDSGIKLPSTFQRFSFDGEFKLFDALENINNSLKGPIDILEVKKSLVRFTITHEMGHTFGLGHNFKANIMPKRGTVPQAIFSQLEKKKNQGMTNFSSIMGYPDAYTDLLIPRSEKKPGPNDISRMKYLYKQEYQVYDVSAHGKGNYQPQKLRQDGRIKSVTVEGKELEPSYLPSCNDIQASLYMDPYCNRFDRGYNARTIMRHSFERYNRFLEKNFKSPIDSLKNRDFKKIERYMWRQTAKTLSRGRLFHDYMRLTYKKEIEHIVNVMNSEKEGEKSNIALENIINFSKNCVKLDGLSSEQLKNKYAEKSYKFFISKLVDSSGQTKYEVNEFGDLCIASDIYFEEIQELLTQRGREFTVVDFLDRKVPGGIISGDGGYDSSQMFGSWKQIGLMPLKIKIMQNVLLPFSLISTGYGDYPLYPYNQPTTSYSMSTLYPKQYLQIIKKLIESGMSFDEEKNNPILARSLLYLGYYLNVTFSSAETKKFPKDFLVAIQKQTQFRFSSAYIKVEGTREDDPDYIKTFSGTIYNRHNSDGEESVGSVYLFTRDRFLMGSQAKSLILPLTTIRWNRESSGLSEGIKLDYESNVHYPKLDVFSPRKDIIDRYKAANKECIGEEKTGLSSYFNTLNEDYKGILIPQDTSKRPESAEKEIVNSIIYNLNQLKKTGFDLEICNKALNEQNLLVLGAALINGFVLPETIQALELGAQ